MSVLAFDIGGTHLRSARVEADGRLLSRRDRRTPVGSADALVAALIEEGRAQQREAPQPLGAIGLAMAGYTDTATGRVLVSPGLGLRDALIGPPLQVALGLPVRLVNDVNAAALGEAHLAQQRDLVAIFVGTGVGTGFVSGGQLIEGHRGMAAEGGHAIWRADGPPCPAGHRGCYESYLGGAALVARARTAGLEATTAELIALWRQGEPRATALLRDAHDALAALCVLLVTLLDPQAVVLAGGVALATPELLDTARRSLDPHPLAKEAGAVTVSLARLGDDAGLLGAALLAREGAAAHGAQAVRAPHTERS